MHSSELSRILIDTLKASAMPLSTGKFIEVVMKNRGAAFG
jgi:hypothetical protein